MSMLTAQCGKLRETAAYLRAHSTFVGFDGLVSINHEMVDAARQVEDAADTIENLRDRLTDTKEVETCRMEQVLDCDELPQPRFWQCHGCGETFIHQRAWYPTYCPECGRKRVVE